MKCLILDELFDYSRKYSSLGSHVSNELTEERWEELVIQKTFQNLGLQIFV